MMRFAAGIGLLLGACGKLLSELTFRLTNFRRHARIDAAHATARTAPSGSQQVTGDPARLGGILGSL